MVRRAKVSVLTIAALVVLGPASALAQEAEVVPASELLERSEAFDGEMLTLEGELVGDYGFRGDGYVWVQLNDDSYARRAIVDGGARTGSNIGVGARMPTVLSDGLDPAGGYRLEGPRVWLTGTWRHHDPERGGESYLDVVDLVVIQDGRRLQEGPDWAVFAAGTLLILVAVGMWLRRVRLAESPE